MTTEFLARMASGLVGSERTHAGTTAHCVATNASIYSHRMTDDVAWGDGSSWPVTSHVAALRALQVEPGCLVCVAVWRPSNLQVR